MRVVAGVDGCKDGWVCIAEAEDGRLSAFVAPTFTNLLTRLPDTAIVAIDVPIGLTDRGPRLCDTHARRLLRAPRASSVFPAPVRRALSGGTYEEVCRALGDAGQPKLSKQAWSIVPKIREVDTVLSAHPALQARVREIHPELCFAVWNGGQAMQYRKATPAGRAEREALINLVWPEAIRQRAGLTSMRCKPDDINDALAALWTARRIQARTARVLPDVPATDRFGLRMEMLA